MNLVWESPWPQWRSHWHVLHAWPPLAQWLLLVPLSVGLTLSVSAWWSADAWQAWWEADEEWQQLEDELHTLQQQAAQLRQRIQSLRDMPHPSGWPVPAWQTWPQAAQTDETQLLQEWLAWGRQHGLVTQALPLTGANAVRLTGAMAAQLAAWHGAPQAFPRLRVTAFEWQRVPGKDSLQLELSWVQAKDGPTVDKPQPPKIPGDKTDMQSQKAPSVERHPAPGPKAHALYNVFQVSALRSGLPPHLLSQSMQGWPQLHHQELAQLRWMGSLDKPGERQALLAFNGLVYPVHVGDTLGRDWGQVTQIGRDHLILREWQPDQNGEWIASRRRLPAGDKP